MDGRIVDIETEQITDKDKKFFELIVENRFERMADDFQKVFGMQNRVTSKMYQYLNLRKIRKALSSYLLDLRQIEKPLWAKSALDKAVKIAFADISQFVKPNGEPNFKTWETVDSEAVKSVKKKVLANGMQNWEIELHDPKPYLDFIMKFSGLLEEESADPLGDIPLPTFLGK